MKKRSFLAGMLTMALIGGLGFSALAATGQVSFNASALSLNGTQVSAKGENYTLANGQSVPASITYTDEKGGGTTYLPVRRISELLGVETGWDGAAGAVTVKGEVKAPAPTTPPTDYSDWSKEDEVAYQDELVLATQDLGTVFDTSNLKMNGGLKIAYTGTLKTDDARARLWSEITEKQKLEWIKSVASEFVKTHPQYNEFGIYVSLRQPILVMYIEWKNGAIQRSDFY